MNLLFLRLFVACVLVFASAGVAMGQAVQPIAVATDAEVCLDSVGNVAMVDDLGRDATYTWTVTGGTIDSGQGGRMIQYRVAKAASATVSVDATAGGMQYHGSAQVQIGPPGGITVPARVPAHASDVEATAPAGSGLSYQWVLSGDGIRVGSTTDQTFHFVVGDMGTVYLSLTVSDGACMRTSMATVTVDQAPVTMADQALTTAGRPVDIDVLANDSDPDSAGALTITAVETPQFGVATIINNGTAVRYTPAGPVMPDTFRYTVSDAEGAKALGRVTIKELFTSTVGDFQGLIVPAPGTLSENARHGFVRVTVARAGRFTGYALLAGVRRAFGGTFGNDGVSQFTKPTAATFHFVRAKGQTPLELSLQLGLHGNPELVGGSLTNAGAPYATLEADRTGSLLAPNAYTFAFLAADAPNRTVPAEKFPQGDGYASGAVGKAGKVSLSGRLADYVFVRAAGTLTAHNRWPFYVSLYRNQGSLSGWIRFQSIAGTSDANAPGLDWFRPPITTASAYSDGWPGGIGVDFLGSKFSAASLATALAAYPTADVDGNTELRLQGGRLPGTGLADAFNVRNKVFSKATANPRRFHDLVITPKGIFTLKFRLPGAKVDTAAAGAFLPILGTGTGFFLDRPHSGLVRFNANEHPAQTP